MSLFGNGIQIIQMQTTENNNSNILPNRTEKIIKEIKKNYRTV